MKNNINKKIGATLLTAAVMTGAFVIPTVKAVDTEAKKPSISYQAHVQDIGWQNAIMEGIAGTTGRSLRMEALKMQLRDCENASLSFDVHLEDLGWKYNCSQNDVLGTTGQSRRMEAIVIRSEGLAAKGYKIQYRVHIQDLGWTNWIDEGNIAGTTGRSLRLEAIEVKMIRDESAIEATREALNDSLDTYKAALSTVKDELTQKGYDKLAKQITEAMEKISEAETIEEMEKIYEEVMDAIIKAYPAIEDLMAKVTTDLQDAQKLAMEILNNYEKVAPTVEGLTEYDVETIKTLIDNARRAVENAKTAEEAKKAKDDFVKLMSTYQQLVNDVEKATEVAEAQEKLIKKLKTYQDALEDISETEISNTMKKVISDKIDMYKEDTMNAKEVDDVTEIENNFVDFIANYPTLKTTVDSTLLENAINEAKEKLTPYLTYKNDVPDVSDPDMGAVEKMAKEAIEKIEGLKTPEAVEAEIKTLFATTDHGGTESTSIIVKVEEIEKDVKANYDKYIKAYNAAIAEIDEYVAYANKLGLSTEAKKAMDSLVKNTKGNLSIAQTEANVDKYMNLFRDSMEQYSSELADYATEQVRTDAIATLKAYEDDKNQEQAVREKAEELRRNIEAKDADGKYTLKTTREIKAELEKINTVINDAEIAKAKANAINEFKVYLEGTEYEANVKNAAREGINAISTGTYKTAEEVRDDFETLMKKVEEALVENNQSAQQLLNEKIKEAQVIIDEYIDIARKSKVDVRTLNGLNALRTEITNAKNITTVANKKAEVEDYINGTIIRQINDAINTLKQIDLATEYPNVIGDNNEPVKAIKEEINKQVENIKTTTSIDKVEEALENAEKAVKALANEINELEGTRKSKINDLKAKFDDLTDEAKLNLYNSYLAEMNAVNLNNYKEDADGEGNDSFDVIIAKAEEALKALEASI